MGSTTHRVLVVGVGSIGERHARCLMQTGRASVGIVEPNESLRATVAERYGFTASYASLDDALDAEPWATAVICTPAQTHVALALQCLDRGIAALIEKPLAVTTAQALPLLARCGSDAPATGVAYVHRAHPALQAMHAAIHEGRFGRPLHVTVTAGQHFPTFRPAYASTYYARTETGGGAIQDALTHLFNAAEWLVGPITRLAVDADHLALPDVSVEDTVNAMARHGEVMAMYALNQHQAPNETALTVVCERGTARYESTRHRWRWQTDPSGDWTVHETPMASRDSWFELQANAWLDVVEGKASPLCTVEAGFQTLAVNETALRSVREGGWLEVDVSAAGRVGSSVQAAPR